MYVVPLKISSAAKAIQQPVSPNTSFTSKTRDNSTLNAKHDINSNSIEFSYINP